MPVYEYRCSDCNKRFELFVPQRMSADRVVCKSCHGANVRKMVSTFASPGAGEELSFASAGADGPSAGGGGCCGGGCGCGH